jgi:hypothetical protein
MADNSFLDFLGSAIGTTPPSYMEGLLGAQDTENLRKQAIGTGAINALLGYMAIPKNQNLGLGRILAGAAQSGIQGAQGVYGKAIEDYQTKAKIDEMKLNRQLQLQKIAEQQAMKTLAPQLIKTTPAVYQDETAMRSVTPAEGAVAPSYDLEQYVPENAKQIQIAPAKKEIDYDVLNRMLAVSSDPLAALKTQAELVPALRKAGMLQTVVTDNPFQTWAETATSPQVQKLAAQYAKSYANGTIDAETADKRIADLAKAEDSYIGRTESAAARKAESDRSFELRSMLAKGQLTQDEFNRQMALDRQAQKNQKVLPPAALKMESENITTAYESAQLANQVDSQIKSLITSGVQFSPAKNAMLATKSAMGSTDPEVLAYNDFQQFKTKLVNDTLRLNKGVQTEGDAVRAANELTNARSTQDVVRSLQKIRNINAQAVAMQNQIVTSRRKTGGLTEDKGYTAAEQVPVPTFESVFYDVNDPAFKALPAGTAFIDGNTGKRKIK